MKICPFCASENIFFSKKRNTFFCEDCEKSFDSPSISSGTRLFLSYGHDKNAEVVKKVKEHLIQSGYDVWMDTSEIAPSKHWREMITNGLIGSNGVISFLSKHSVRVPGVCLDELRIAIYLKKTSVTTILLEKEDEVDPPRLVKNIQWLDMSNWDEIGKDQWDDYFKEKMSELFKTLESDDVSKHSEELDFLSQQLKVSDYACKEQLLLKRAFIGREWLSKRVQDWVNAPSSDPFVIYGVPGSGKSAFAANFSQLNPSVVAFIFFEWDHSELRNIDVTIKTLAIKLAASLPDYRRMLCSLYRNEESKKSIDQYHGASLFDAIILNPLQCSIDGDREKGIIVFDGLDETSVEVADLLIEKAKQFPDWVKAIFTSRHDPLQERRFRKENVILLDKYHEGNVFDLKEYLSSRLNLPSDDPIIAKAAEKCEGSFMYATSLCEAIERDSLSLSDINGLPEGLNSFYLTFFKRLFPTHEQFLETRPLLELLCVDEELPEPIFSLFLGLDHYALWELRLNIKNLIVGEEASYGGVKFRKIKFVHQSIREWLSDPALAGEFYVDPLQGYARLAKFCEEFRYNGEEISEKEIAQRDKRIEAATRHASEKEKRDFLFLVRMIMQGNYLKWLIRCGRLDDAKACLLASFDENALLEKSVIRIVPSLNYNLYYDLLDFWQWADLFPLDYPVEELVDKLTEIVSMPLKYMASTFSHRSIQISLLLLKDIMKSGRYKEPLFKLLEKPLAGYFTSKISDEMDTRNGLDKELMARDAAICIKTLESYGTIVPHTVKDNVEKMKLTHIYDYGEPINEEHRGYKSFLSNSQLAKDICALSENELPSETMKSLLADYNTESLRVYLSETDDIDADFVEKIAEYHANIGVACDLALEEIEKKVSLSASPKAASQRFQKRIDYILSLKETNRR